MVNEVDANDDCCIINAINFHNSLSDKSVINFGNKFSSIFNNTDKHVFGRIDESICC